MAICMHTADVTCVYCDSVARTGFVRVSPGPLVPQVLATTNVDPDDIKKQYDEMNAAVERKQRRERREKIAAQVFAGFAQNPAFFDAGPYRFDWQIARPEMVRRAVELADALIAELDKEGL